MSTNERTVLTAEQRRNIEMLGSERFMLNSNGNEDRCGHNYVAADCHYAGCGFRTCLVDLDNLRAENERLKQVNVDLSFAVAKQDEDLASENGRLREVLKQVQWGNRFENPACPACGRFKDVGTHKPDCLVGAALEGGK
jgi:hypothetical protein